MLDWDITVTSQAHYVNGGDGGYYDNNVVLEDELIVEALQAQGLTVTYKAWDDTSFDWGSTRFVLIRSVWDYFERYEEFKIWLETLEGKTTLINSAEIIHWNKHKSYLEEMANNGINIAASKFVKQGDEIDLTAMLSETGWKKAVVKPCVAGGGVDTHRFDRSTIDQMQKVSQDLVLEKDMIFQEFQEDVAERGEISVMVFGGKFSHAVLKVAKQGDFRVQDDWGGSVYDYTPTPQEIAFAEQCIAACPYDPIYARVDIFNDNSGMPALAELELIEPELWFRNKPESAQLLAETIYHTIENQL